MIRIHRHHMRSPFGNSRPAILLVLVAGLSLSAPPAAPAQEEEAKQRKPFYASPYVHLGSWEYPILDYWISAGRISSLSPFVQPYRRIEVAEALLELDAEELSAGEREWLARLRNAYQYELTQLTGENDYDAYLAMDFAGGGSVRSQTHRDLLRPELEGRFSETKLLGDFRARFEGAAGPVAGSFNAFYHGIYLEDPQFPDGLVVQNPDALLFESWNEMALRVEEAYVEVQSRYARLSVGQMYRNWGAPSLDGFLRSDYAYSEPDIGYRLGVDRVYLVGMFASYRDFGADTAHYVAIHRLEIRPIDDLMISLSEASVHGGPGQGVDFRLVNPLGIWMLARADDDPSHNKMGQADVWWRATPGVTAYGSLLVDASLRDESKFGGSLGLELSRLVSGLVLRGSFSYLESLTYTPNNPTLPWEEYSVERIGIGWDKIDLYLVSLEADWFPSAGLWLRPKLDIQIMGEGDFRNDRPPPEELPDWPHILVGDPETTIRPAIEGKWRSGWKFPLELTWDVGVNFIQDYANEVGDDRVEFVGNVGVLIRTPRWEFGLR